MIDRVTSCVPEMLFVMSISAQLSHASRYCCIEARASFTSIAKFTDGPFYYGFVFNRDLFPSHFKIETKRERKREVLCYVLHLLFNFSERRRDETLIDDKIRWLS